MSWESFDSYLIHYTISLKWHTKLASHLSASRFIFHIIQWTNCNISFDRERVPNSDLQCYWNRCSKKRNCVLFVLVYGTKASLGQLMRPINKTNQANPKVKMKGSTLAPLSSSFSFEFSQLLRPIIAWGFYWNTHIILFNWLNGMAQTGSKIRPHGPGTITPSLKLWE